jgi:hypothetical protein
MSTSKVAGSGTGVPLFSAISSTYQLGFFVADQPLFGTAVEEIVLDVAEDAS